MGESGACGCEGLGLWGGELKAKGIGGKEDRPGGVRGLWVGGQGLWA